MCFLLQKTNILSYLKKKRCPFHAVRFKKQGKINSTKIYYGRKALKNKLYQREVIFYYGFIEKYYLTRLSAYEDILKEDILRRKGWLLCFKYLTRLRYNGRNNYPARFQCVKPNKTGLFKPHTYSGARCKKPLRRKLRKKKIEFRFIPTNRNKIDKFRKLKQINKNHQNKRKKERNRIYGQVKKKQGETRKNLKFQNQPTQSSTEKKVSTIY